MELPKKKLEDLICAADKIIEANNQTQEDLFGQVKNPNAISEILDIPLQDPKRSYTLYYQNIQKFLGDFLLKNRHKAQRKAKFYINKCRSASCMQSGRKRTLA